MVKENKLFNQEHQATFSSEEQKKYWELWHSYRGNTARVATVCGVTTATVQEHVLRTARSSGFDGIKHAKKHFGYKTGNESTDVQVQSSDLKKLIEMQGYKCALSGVRLDPKNAELDHKTPLSRGGTNDLGNLQWVTKQINRAKGTMDNAEFLAMCKLVAGIK